MVSVSLPDASSLNAIDGSQDARVRGIKATAGSGAQTCPPSKMKKKKSNNYHGIAVPPGDDVQPQQREGSGQTGHGAEQRE